MLSKEEIEHIKSTLKENRDYIFEFDDDNIKIEYVLEYIEQLEAKSDWQQLSNECSSIADKVGFTKEDTDKIIKETREMQAKAEKYDSLVMKIKDKIEEINAYKMDIVNSPVHNSDEKIEMLRKNTIKKEILQELLKEAESE